MGGRSIAKVTQDTGLSRATIYREIKKGALHAKKVGDRTIIFDDAYNAWRNNLPDLVQAA